MYHICRTRCRLDDHESTNYMSCRCKGIWQSSRQHCWPGRLCLRAAVESAREATLPGKQLCWGRLIRLSTLKLLERQPRGLRTLMNNLLQMPLFECLTYRSMSVRVCCQFKSCCQSTCKFVIKTVQLIFDVWLGRLYELCCHSKIRTELLGVFCVMRCSLESYLRAHQ